MMLIQKFYCRADSETKSIFINRSAFKIIIDFCSKYKILQLCLDRQEITPLLIHAVTKINEQLNEGTKAGISPEQCVSTIINSIEQEQFWILPVTIGKKNLKINRIVY